MLPLHLRMFTGKRAVSLPFLQKPSPIYQCLRAFFFIQRKCSKPPPMSAAWACWGKQLTIAPRALVPSSSQRCFCPFYELENALTPLEPSLTLPSFKTFVYAHIKQGSTNITPSTSHGFPGEPCPPSPSRPAPLLNKPTR